MALTPEEIADAEIIAAIAQVAPPEAVREMIDLQFEYYERHRPGFLEEIGRLMCGK